MIRSWRLDDSRQTLVLGSHKNHLAEVTYWGPRLPEDEDLDTLYLANNIDVTGGMLDINPELSICPEATRTFPGQPGLIIRDGSGTPLLPKFCFASADHSENSITLAFEGNANGLSYKAHFSINPATHVIEASAVLETAFPAHLHWLSAPVFPAPQLTDEMIDFFRALVWRISDEPYPLGAWHTVSRKPHRAHRA